MSINSGCFLIDVVDSISRLCNCIAPHKDYVCNLKENIDLLRNETEGLTALKNDVKRRVHIAEVQHQLKMLDRVQVWLTRVERMEAEVDQLIAVASQEIEKNCLGGCCPKNCPSTYKQGKKVAKKIKQVTNLKGEGNLQEVAEKQLLPSELAAERPSRPTVGLESAFIKAQSYIGDEGVGIIGIYGMGGVGKTTLLTQINNNLCANFDFVIWLVVSKNSTIGKVQDGIGEKLGFHDDKWKNECQEDKATSIFGVLKRKKFVLLLDDIWEQIDLLKVGIPVPDKYNKSKVVFTTRSEDVCGRMETQKKIKVECLVPEKAWDLFQEKVGEDALNSHLEIPELAKILANECKGLPLALITIGRAMACKMTPQEWRHALDVMKENAAKFSGMGDAVLPTLKFSYDNLRSDLDRSCFLYCSLFPEDYLISKETLIEYWIGEGLLDGFNDLNKGYDIIGTLIHACLLEEVSHDSVRATPIITDMSGEVGEVKMHDVIRDMALWIASKCGEVEDNFLVQAGNKLKKPPHIGKWKDAERMSLMQNEIKELIETPSCPHLSTLLLSGNRLKMITPDFFQNMANLKVLDLSRNSSLEVLPVEISKLVSLQYLNLYWTGIKKLPIEYKNLVNLKYLNLEHTHSRDMIPLGLLSSFKKLGVLKIFRTSLIFGKDSDFEAFLSEVEGLKDLNQFSLSIRTISTLSHMLRSPKILSCTNLLGLFRMKGLKSQDLSFLQSMRRLQHLLFQGCKDLEDLKVETTREEEANSDVIISHAYCFHSLRSIYIVGSEKLKEVTWLRFAPNLEILSIQSCYGMEEVICRGKYGEASAPEEGGGYLNLFAKLKELYLFDLPQLTSICPNAQSFPCLKFLRVIKCPNLKKLPLNSDSARGCLVQIKGETEWWNELEWEDEATQNAFLPFFKSLD